MCRQRAWSEVPIGTCRNTQPTISRSLMHQNRVHRYPIMFLMYSNTIIFDPDYVVSLLIKEITEFCELYNRQNVYSEWNLSSQCKSNWTIGRSKRTFKPMWIKISRFSSDCVAKFTLGPVFVRHLRVRFAWNDQTSPWFFVGTELYFELFVLFHW